VAQALMPAASALLPTLAFDTVSRARKGVEMSLDTADTSVCATVWDYVEVALCTWGGSFTMASQKVSMDFITFINCRRSTGFCM
jgi:hypothetical protein